MMRSTGGGFGGNESKRTGRLTSISVRSIRHYDNKGLHASSGREQAPGRCGLTGHGFGQHRARRSYTEGATSTLPASRCSGYFQARGEEGSHAGDSFTSLIEILKKSDVPS